MADNTTPVGGLNNDANLLNLNLESSEKRINDLREQRIKLGQEEIEQKREIINDYRSIESSLLKQYGLMDNIYFNQKSTLNIEREIIKNKNKVSELDVKEGAFRKLVNSSILSEIKGNQELLKQAYEKSNSLEQEQKALEVTKSRLESIGADTFNVEQNIRNVRNLVRDAYNEQSGLEDELQQKLRTNDAEGNYRKIIALQNMKVAIGEQNTELVQTLKHSEKLDRNIFSITNSVVSRLPQLGAFSQAFRHSAEAAREANGGFKGMVEGSRSMLGSIFATEVILGLFIKAAFKADEEVTELAKSLGLAKDNASDLRGEIADYAANSKDAFITTHKLVEAQLALTKNIGIATSYSGKQLEDFTRLTKLMGLSEESASSMATFSILNHKTIEETVKTMFKGQVAAQSQTHTLFDGREILKEISSLSVGIAVKFKGNTEALAAAVVQAKALGLSLEQVDKSGDSLLDFEGSLERTLKAELLTGREINVERARSAALLGDQQSLLNEITNQVGDLAGFNKLNILAQRGLAEAFGMSRDELAKMLITQEKFKALGPSINKTAQEQLAYAEAHGISLEQSLYTQLTQQAAQEKFNNTVAKLEDLLGRIVNGNLMSVIDGLSNMLSHTTAIKILFGTISSILWGKMIFGAIEFGTRMAVIAGFAEATALANLTSASALTLGIGIAGVVAGIATAVAAFHSAKKSVDHHDAVMSGDGKTMFSGARNSIKFDADDTIVAGTNLFGSKKSNDSDKKLDEVIDVLKKINKKETNLYLSESKLAIATAIPMGTNMQKNISNFA